MLEGSQTDICQGKPIAFIGHKVSCPKCRGTQTIVEGVQTTTNFGKGVAVAGMKTSCGATLVASQFTDIVAPGGGAGGAPAAPPASSKAAAAAAAPGAGAGAGTAAAAGPAAAAGQPAANAAKSVKRIWWSYGKDETPLDDFSRHYVDLNLHAETENYASGESVPVEIRNDDGTDLAQGLPQLAVQLAVGPDGIGKALNVFAGKTVMLGMIG